MNRICSICKKNKDIRQFYQLKGKRYPQCRDCSKEKSREWYKKNKIAHNQRIQNQYKELRAECILLLGGKCGRCDLKDKRVLCIDHIDGDGAEERLVVKGSNQMYRKFLVKIKTGNHRYQLLCLNCNWIKALEQKEI